jgi:DNA gyrase/topoisomerase IV subunit B
LKFDSQTKERVTNSTSEIKNKVGDIPVDKVVRTIMSDKDLIDEILAYTKLQENLEAKKDLDKLNKKKKIKSDKFFDSVGGTKRIFVCEGDSALGGMMSILGRKGNAFYALKGVPMNVMGISHQKFMSNKELSELYSIITSTDSEVIICSDADADGSHIVGLLILFFQTYFKNELNSGKIKRLVTPLIVGTKGDKVVEWSYDLKTEETKGVSYSYSKGLGSWDKDQLRFIIESEGFENMLQTANSVDDSILEDWFGTNSSARKDMIKSFPAFDISVV